MIELATEKNRLIETLSALQGDASDRAFAKKLGISNGLWSATRRGETVLGRKVLRGVLKAYPHLKPFVEEYWQGYLHDGKVA